MLDLRLTSWMLGFVMLTSPAVASSSAEILVVGAGDPAIDRQAIQDAIDLATPGTTVRLRGVFQLDGERIEIVHDGLRLVGDAIDDDQDGAVQEDWVDGLDNDGDGLIDEDDWDTLLLGVEAPGGGPANPRGEEGMFNRALTLEGRVVRGLVVRDLHFVHHYRAIEILPEWATPDGECGNRTRVDGAARGVTIVRNRFTDNTLGVTLLGRVHGATVRANVFERHAIFGAVVEGRSVDCPLAGGGAVELALATPRRTVFRHNRSIGSGGLGATFTERTTIVDNRIRGAIVGILAGGDRNAAFRRNTITDGDIGFALFADESTMRIRRNVIDVSLVGISALGHADAVRVVGNTIDGGLWGLQVGAEASGYHAIENHYGEHLIVDVELGVGSSGNSVVNNDGLPITVSDQGIDNRVEGNIVPF